MTVILRASLVLLLLALVVPVAGPVSAAPAAPSLFPLILNAEWTRKNDDGTTSVSKVTGAKTVGNVRCIVIERKFTLQGRERVERNCYLATATEITVIETTNFRGDPTTLKPPRALLKFPPKAGQTWSWAPEESTLEVKLTSKWVGEETIKVGTVQYKAWKLETITAGEDMEIKAYTWYAPGIGAVRGERKGYRGDRKISGWTELVSVKIP
jgi:hypothetical protein